MLLKTIANQLEMQNDKEQQKPIIQPCISKRQLPHFCYQREEDTANSLKSLNQKGDEQNPDTGMGIIQQQILEAIYDVEKDNKQMCFLIYGVKQGWLMGNTVDAGLSTDKAREAGMIG
jgi:hypothetical protein